MYKYALAQSGRALFEGLHGHYWPSPVAEDITTGNGMMAATEISIQSSILVKHV
jgi:hypothetical protein